MEWMWILPSCAMSVWEMSFCPTFGSKMGMFSLGFTSNITFLPLSRKLVRQAEGRLVTEVVVNGTDKNTRGNWIHKLELSTKSYKIRPFIIIYFLRGDGEKWVWNTRSRKMSYQIPLVFGWRSCPRESYCGIGRVGQIRHLGQEEFVWEQSEALEHCVYVSRMQQFHIVIHRLSGLRFLLNSSTTHKVSPEMHSSLS